MSKSKGETLTLSLLKSKGYDPMDYRYFCLGGHYRSQLQFSYKALDSARTARTNLVTRVQELLEKEAVVLDKQELSEKASGYITEFISHIEADLNMPRALSVVWGVIKDGDLTPSEKLTILFDIDKVLGLRIDKVKAVEPQELSNELLTLIEERETARKERNFARADEIRDILREKGIEIKDTASGTKWKSIV